MKKPWRDWDFEKLADDAETGTVGQGAVVDATRRLIESVLELTIATQATGDCAATQNAQMIKLTTALKVLTWVLVGVGGVQIVLMVWQLMHGGRA